MKWYKSADGEQRIWYEQDEIEDIAADELRRAELFPTLEAPIVDLEKFIESHLHAKLDQYAVLPNDVLGSTAFEPGAPPRVEINRNLTTSAVDEPRAGAFGRWRATMAHEGCHILLHRVLFELDPDQAMLFDLASNSSARPRLMRCLQRNIVGRGGGDWREVQANRGMAALLMPRQVFKAAVVQEMAAMGVAAVETATEAARALAGRMAARCAISREAASIRLDTLECLRVVGHRALPLE